MRSGTPSLPSRHTLKLMALGAVSFWLPDTLYQAIKGSKFDWPDVRILTALMPLTLLGTYILTKKRYRNESERRVGVPMMLGVWLLGGIFITISASLSGGGFAGPSGFSGGIISLLLSFVPPYLFILATYDGSLGALLIVSVVATIIWAVARRKEVRRLG